MILSKVRKGAVDYIISRLRGNEAEFCIDEVLFFNEDRIILFVTLPTKFRLQRELGMTYFFINESVVYNERDDSYNLVDPILFLSEKNNCKEYLESIVLHKHYSYEEIVMYLDKRGYLIWDDFEKLFKDAGILQDNLIFSFSDKQKTEILIQGVNSEQLNFLIDFFKNIKADYQVNKSIIRVKKDLINSKSFYDEKENLIIDRAGRI